MSGWTMAFLYREPTLGKLGEDGEVKVVEDAPMLVQWSDELIDSTGVPADSYGNTTPLELLPFSAPASHALFEYGRAMREERTRNPKDDLTTALVEARYEGEALSDYDVEEGGSLV